MSEQVSEQVSEQDYTESTDSTNLDQDREPEAPEQSDTPAEQVEQTDQSTDDAVFNKAAAAVEANAERVKSKTKKASKKKDKENEMPPIPSKTAPSKAAVQKSAPAPKQKAAKAAVQKSANPDRGMSAIDAAAKVLKLAKGKGLSCNEMIERMSSGGLWTSPGGKTPAATLYSSILREIAVRGNASRFTKVDKGRFAFNADAANHDGSAKDGKPVKTAAPTKGGAKTKTSKAAASTKE